MDDSANDHLTKATMLLVLTQSRLPNNILASLCDEDLQKRCMDCFFYKTRSVSSCWPRRHALRTASRSCTGTCSSRYATPTASRTRRTSTVCSSRPTGTFCWCHGGRRTAPDPSIRSRRSIRPSTATSILALAEKILTTRRSPDRFDVFLRAPPPPPLS